MSEATIQDLRRQIFTFQSAKEYEQAYQLCISAANQFPQDAFEILYYCICMSALTGRHEEALQRIKQALDQDIWFSPRVLETDDDLISLRPLPEFTRLVAINQQRNATAQANTRSELMVKLPAEQSSMLPLLIALHGNLSNMAEAAPQWQPITLNGWLLAVPQSSQIDGWNAYVWDKRDQGAADIRAHLIMLSKQYTLDPERVVLGGFSMGGGQAIWMALQQSITTRGFVVLNPWLSEQELEALPTLLETPRLAGVRGSILIEENDAEHLLIARKVVDLMQANGLACELVFFPSLDYIYYPGNFSELVANSLAFIEKP